MDSFLFVLFAIFLATVIILNVIETVILVIITNFLTRRIRNNDASSNTEDDSNSDNEIRHIYGRCSSRYRGYYR